VWRGVHIHEGATKRRDRSRDNSSLGLRAGLETQSLRASLVLHRYEYRHYRRRNDAAWHLMVETRTHRRVCPPRETELQRQLRQSYLLFLMIVT